MLLFTGDDAENTAATCDNAVSVYFVDDADMRAAASKLQDDELPKATSTKPVDCPPAKRGKPDLARYVLEELCGRVNVLFETDEAMLAAKDAVAADPLVYSMRALTKQQSYERAKEVLADDPKLLELLTPDALPALLELRTRADADAEQLATKLAGSLQGVQDAKSRPCLALPRPVADG